MSSDLRTMKNSFREILINKEIIAVNQDPVGLQGGRVQDVASMCVCVSVCFYLFFIMEFRSNGLVGT
jgi:hypothetical protein